MNETEAVERVTAALTDELRQPKYRGADRLRGHCYVASEAIFHLIGRYDSGYEPMRVLHEGAMHWFLRRPSDGAVLDATAGQFASPVPYERARRNSFRHPDPSARAVTVIERARRGWTPADRPQLLVAPCSYKAAEYAVTRWHYSKSMPAPRRIMLGIWEAGEFTGTIIFGRGGSPHLGKPFGLAHTEIAELTRIAMRKHATPVSQCVSIALKWLKQNSPGLRLVVSFADPEHDHHGGIYQAGNWLYLGTTAGETQYVVHGRQRHARSLAPTQFGTGRKLSRSMTYLRAYIDPNATTVKTAGKHRYAMPFDRAMRRQLLPRVQPYPHAGERSMGSAALPAPPGGFDPRTRLDDDNPPGPAVAM